MQVRNVNVGRGYELEADAFEGLKSAANTNRVSLSLEYVVKLFEDLLERVSNLEAQLAEATKAQAAKPAAKKAAAVKDDAVDDAS